MKKTALSKFDRLMAAVTFAEEGEFETARQILKEEMERKTPRQTEYKRPSDRKIQKPIK